ncbi:MAG: alpha-(1-2)-phosphatidylinositol mannosyltransferase [Pseudonocardiales bacterium]|nr:alpha-(1-2)-phosphatidylinositol mannosyltransferase [Pseudonocardiales bacterium]
MFLYAGPSSLSGDPLRSHIRPRLNGPDEITEELALTLPTDVVASDGSAPARRRVLVVTNDFPPRQGGIQAFVHALVSALPAEEVVVYASNYDGAKDFDAAQPFRVVRHPTGLLIPTPGARRRITALAREHRADAVWFGAAAPLALLAPSLRAVGVSRIVASTHGHEIGWARLPGARSLMRRIAAEVDVLTYLGEYTRHRLERVVGGRAELVHLPPGVDVGAFRPDVSGADVRRRYGIAPHGPVVVCVSRLVPRKGQDALIDAWTGIADAVPGARLLIVGRGPYEKALKSRVQQHGVGQSVIFTGGVPSDQLPAHFAAGDVFAMPCRTRRRGLDVEGLGIVYLEASADGLPVVAGDSGGAPEAVREGETGFVVDGRDLTQLTRAIVTLLTDSDLRQRMGAAGRSWVEANWQWSAAAATLDGLLQA